MGLTNDIATALAAKLASVSGMAGAAATGAGAVHDVPYAVLGPARSSEISPGSWETEIIEFPLTVLVSAIVEESDSLAAAYDVKDAVQAALRSGITLGLAGSGIAQTYLADWNTDAAWSEVGGQAYQALEGTIRVTVARGMAGSWSA